MSFTDVSTPVLMLARSDVVASVASRFARATSSTYTKSRVCFPSPKMVGALPSSMARCVQTVNS